MHTSILHSTYCNAAIFNTGFLPGYSTLVVFDCTHTWIWGVALQEAAAKQQSMLDDEASSSGDDDEDADEDEDEDEDDEEEDSDEDDAARKERGIAYLKKALTSQPLNGNANSDDGVDVDDDDMEVGFSIRLSYHANL